VSKENYTPRSSNNNNNNNNNGFGSHVSSASHGHGHGHQGENSRLQQTPANAWQQAPSRKGGHKKSKSAATGGRASHAPRTGGEPLPANEADRKGG
jgi:hypothetical protein